jgi:CRP-like cAMP-binding protein
MIFGKRRHLKNALRALDEGDRDEAIDALTRFLEKAPGDTKYRRQCADLCASVGRVEEAVAHYEALVGAYVGEGLGLKAIAACRALLAVDPEHEETQRALARLARGRGVDPDAVMTPAMKRGSEPPPVPEDDDEDDEELIDAEDLLVAEQVNEPEVPLEAVPLFSELSQTAFAELLAGLELWRSPTGSVIVEEGEKGDSFFVVVSGGVRVERATTAGDREVVGTLGPGDFFGEIAALSGLPRTATIIAARDSELLEVKRAQLDAVLSAHPTVERALRRFLRTRLIENAMQAPMFAGLSGAARDDVVGAFRTVTIPMGRAVISQGAAPDGLFVVLGGDLEVERGGETLAQLRAGDVFGEMGLFFDEPASATVSALTDAKVLKLGRKAFGRFCARHPSLASRLEELSLARAVSNESAEA